MIWNMILLLLSTHLPITSKSIFMMTYGLISGNWIYNPAAGFPIAFPKKKRHVLPCICLLYCLVKLSACAFLCKASFYIPVTHKIRVPTCFLLLSGRQQHSYLPQILICALFLSAALPATVQNPLLVSILYILSPYLL